MKDAEKLCIVPSCDDFPNNCLVVTVKQPACWRWHSLVFEDQGKKYVNHWLEPCTEFSAVCETIAHGCKLKNGTFDDCNQPVIHQITGPKDYTICSGNLSLSPPQIDKDITPVGEYQTACGRWGPCK